MYARIVSISSSVLRLKDYKAVRISFKLMFVFLFAYILSYHIGDYQSFLEKYDRMGLGRNLWSWLGLLLAVALMPLNWALEGQKWRILMPDSHLSLKQAVQVILGGLSLGVVSPARIGEFAGRAILTADKNKWKSLFASLLNSVAQNTVHLVFGLLGLVYMLHIYVLPLSLLWVYLVGLIIIGLLLFFLNAQAILRIAQSKWKFTFLSKLEPGDDIALVPLLLLTVIRYAVYSAQFVLLLYFFGTLAPVFPIVMAVLLIFLVQTGLPLPPFLSALARVEIATLILSYEIDNELLIVGSTLSLWIINVMAPSIVGTIILLRRKAIN